MAKSARGNVHVGLGGSSSQSRTLVLVILTALSAFNHLDRQLIAIVLEPIRVEFALGDLQLGLLSGLAFAAIYTTLGIPAALWAVRGNRVNLISMAAIFWGAMTALAGFAQSFVHLLVTRIGVGVGEAGFLPSAHAIISALYRKGERATALAIMSAGVNIGVFIAFLVGGVVSHFFGWRVAFVLSGLATVATAIAFKLFVREPEREAPDEIANAPAPRVAFASTLRSILFDPVLRNVAIAAMLTSCVSYGALAWLPSFLVRSHGFSLAQAGIYLALIIGIGGGVGTWLGGHYSDRLGARDVRWSLWFIAIAYIATKPLVVGFFLVENPIAAMLLFVLPAATGAIFVGPSISVLHDRTSPALRPVASAIFIFLTSFIGLGLAPVIVGFLSQYVFHAEGEDSLRWALIVLQALGVWGGLHFIQAGRLLGRGVPSTS